VAQAWNQLDRNIRAEVCRHAVAVVQRNHAAVQHQFGACVHFHIARALLRDQEIDSVSIKQVITQLWGFDPSESELYDKYCQREHQVAHLFKQREDWQFWLDFDWDNAGSYIKQVHFRVLNESYVELRRQSLSDGLALPMFHQRVIELLTSSRRGEGDGSLASKLVGLGVRKEKQPAVAAVCRHHQKRRSPRLAVAPLPQLW
jgi:hypothetical protein